MTIGSMSAGVEWNATIFAGDLDADERSLQRNGGAVPIDVGVAGGGDAFLRSCQRSFSAAEVDFLGTLGGFREHRNAVRQNFREPADDSERNWICGCAGAIAQLSDAKLGDERGVAGQNTQFSVEAGDYDLNDLLPNNLPFGSDHDQFDGIGKHFLFSYLDALDFMVSAFFKTSSMVPTM